MECCCTSSPSGHGDRCPDGAWPGSRPGPPDVRGSGVRVVGIGVVIGVVAALAFARALSGLLFGIAAMDTGTFIGMSALMIVIGSFASYVPARRASSVDPMEFAADGLKVPRITRVPGTNQRII
jgi:hypothetical protein